MTMVAESRGLVTQMGDVGASSDGIRTAQEIIEAGIIGKVNKVDCWTNRPVWPQGLQPPTSADPVPDYLSWDLWLGPAADRDFNHRIYRLNGVASGTSEPEQWAIWAATFLKHLT